MTEELQPTESLRKMLKNIGSVYNEGEPVEVEWTDGPSAAGTDGQTVGINPSVEWASDDLSGADQLRIIANTLSHEVEHLRESELAGKSEFMQARPDGAAVAGAVINTLEDQYIDRTRTERWRGLRGTQAFVTDTVMDNDEVRPPIDTIDSKTGQLVEGFVQLAFAGKVKGIANVDDDVQQFLGDAKSRIDAARHADDPAERERIAGEVYDRLKDAAGDEFDGREGREHVEQYVPGGGELAEEGDDIEQEQTDAPVDTDAASDSDGDGNSGGDGDTDDESDADSVSGEATTGDESEVDTAQTAQAVEELVDADEEGDYSAGGWYGLDEDDDYETDDDFERRFKRLRELEAEEQSPIGQRKAERDEVSAYHENDPWGEDPLGTKWRDDSHDGDGVRRAVAERQVEEEVVEVFRRFTTADDHVAAREGSRVNLPAAVEFASGNFGRDDLFLRSKPIEHGDRAVGLTLDTSGSMFGSMLDAKVAVAAFWLAAREIGDTFVANSFYWGTQQDGRSEDGVYTDLLVAPDEQDIDWDLLDAAAAYGGTPTTAGMADMKAMLDDVQAREKLMVVVTDGRPQCVTGIAHDDYHPDEYPRRNGQAATEESTTYIAALRDEGYTVIGVAVNEDVDSDTMNTMFDHDGWVRTDAGNLADTLIEIYERQMNPDAA